MSEMKANCFVCNREIMLGLFPEMSDKEKKENPFAAEASEQEATAEVFEDGETSEATMVEASVDEADELESTRASLSEYIGTHILNK